MALEVPDMFQGLLTLYFLQQNMQKYSAYAQSIAHSSNTYTAPFSKKLYILMIYNTQGIQ